MLRTNLKEVAKDCIQEYGAIINNIHTQPDDALLKHTGQLVFRGNLELHNQWSHQSLQ